MKFMFMMALLASFIPIQATENCSEEYLCKDDRVNYGTKVGIVKEVFSNGNAQIKFDGDDNFSYLQVRGLGKGVPCVGEICKGDRVNYGAVSGKVEEVFTNGRAKIKLDEQKEYAFNMTVRLGKSFECIENLCKGSRVNYGSVVGTAVEVYTNGNVKILVDESETVVFTSAANVGYAIDCSNENDTNRCVKISL